MFKPSGCEDVGLENLRCETKVQILNVLNDIFGILTK